MREDDLAKRNVWWWRTETEAYELIIGQGRYFTKAKPGLAGEQWKKQERAVHRYELARRDPRLKSFGLLPFSLLSEEQRSEFLHIFGDDFDDGIEDAPPLRPRRITIWLVGEAEWSRRRWIKELDQFLSIHRKQYELQKSKGTKKGQQNRPPSWRWPELLDVAKARKRSPVNYPPFNDTETKALSQARKFGREAANHLLLSRFQLGDDVNEGLRLTHDARAAIARFLVKR